MTASCFKIIACGRRDSVDDEPVEASHESKSASDKRGWSFGKRSARHRVLSNTVISETPPALTKDSSASAAVDFQRQPNSTIPDKISAVQWTEEKPRLATPVNSELSKTIAAQPDEQKADADPDESLVITIQAAIRGFLAHKVLLKHKNIIKLQAVVRGHLVRSHAVGTLRCVHAIIKMQALVRARRARILEEGSRAAEEPKKHGKDDISPLTGKVNSGNKAPVTYTSREKLLRNGFARKLLHSSLRTKSINIKCDPSKTDSAWKWLERWMSVYSTENEPLLDIVLKDEKNIEHVDSQDETVILPKSNCKSADLNLGMEESENDDNLITYDAKRFDIQACQPSSPSGKHNLGSSELQNIGGINSEEIVLDSLATQQKESDFRRKVDSTINGAEGVQSAKGISPEHLETEGKKFPVGSRKASNPAFLAVQSKFEELSSSAISTKSISSTNQDIEVESYAESISSFTDHASRKKESGLAENLVSNNAKVQSGGPDASRLQCGGSECGTELSISSTLDSPDRSDGGANVFEHESKIIKDRKGHPETKEKFEVEAKGESIILDSGPHKPDAVQPERGITAVNDDGADSVMSIDISQVQQMPNTDVSMLHMEAETKKGNEVCKLSPDASPRRHVTVSEPQGTPSSEVSVNPKRMRGEKSGSNRKPKSSSAGKRSPKLNHGSGASSTEQLPKDHKTGKRRNSLGSPKPDLVDQEPRDSSSSNSLPSYMQPTESARAKALLLSSPRSSPDLQDKEVYIKKRHSLPGANVRNGSPQIQRTMSQTQHAVKGDVTQSPQERKWLR